MKKKNINILSFKNPIMNNHRSNKINNKFKKSSTTQYNYINKKGQYNNKNNNPNIKSINNNIYLNLFNKFSNTSSLRKNALSPKQIISSRINNSHINNERRSLNIFEVPSSSSIKNKKNYGLEHSSLINSMNFIDNHGHINIRLNLKNQFISGNNNFNNITDMNYGSDIAEKMKEKDLKIMQLQNDLIKSQEIINQFQIKNNLELNKYNYNLNNSSPEKNLCILTKSSESVDKIIKTVFNGYNINDYNKKKTNKNKKNYKNTFLKNLGNHNILECLKKSKTKDRYDSKKSERDNSKSNKNLYSGNIKRKQSDYLKLFLPLSNFHSNKFKFNSYSNNKRNNKNKINSNTENLNKTEKNKHNNFNQNDNCVQKKKNDDFSKFTEKCEKLKEKTKQLLNRYIDLGNYIQKTKIK